MKRSRYGRFLLGVLITLLSGSGMPVQAWDVEKMLREKLKEYIPASATIQSVMTPETRQKLLQRVKKHLPEPLQDVDEVLADVPQPNEIAIGRQIAGNLLGAAPLVEDIRLQRYVNQVGRWVAEQTERPDLPWVFGVIESTDVNAFAAPGGFVFVTRGLYELLTNEGELAGVLAHEIGHVLRRHHLKILKKSRLLDMGRQLISQKMGKNQIAQELIGDGAEIVARSLDQEAEFEADRIAVVLAARAGYDGFCLPGVLRQIGHFTRDDDKVALLFKTHPHPDVRKRKLDAGMGRQFDQVQGLTLPTRLYRMKPRLKAK